MKDRQAFVAYPSTPPSLVEVISKAVGLANSFSRRTTFLPWSENDIAGKPLVEPIFERIEKSAFLVADITYLNFNVTYEIGYAIGMKRRVFLTKNATMVGDNEKISKVGIFDTLGYENYDNARSLADLLSHELDLTPLSVAAQLDSKAPVYIVETPRRSDAMVHFVSKIKKARLQYRSFNPQEEIRLSATDAIKHVARSHGVLIPLLSREMADAETHNIRAAFVAGLSHGMGRPTLIAVQGSEPVPLDIRDFVKRYNSIPDIDALVNSFALDTVQSLQAAEQIDLPFQSELASLTIGDPMAENEFQTLERYFL